MSEALYPVDLSGISIASWARLMGAQDFIYSLSTKPRKEKLPDKLDSIVEQSLANPQQTPATTEYIPGWGRVPQKEQPTKPKDVQGELGGMEKRWKSVEEKAEEDLTYAQQALRKFDKDRTRYQMDDGGYVKDEKYWSLSSDTLTAQGGFVPVGAPPFFSEHTSVLVCSQCGRVSLTPHTYLECIANLKEDVAKFEATASSWRRKYETGFKAV